MEILSKLVDEFSLPFKTTDEVKTVSMKLDSIAGILLASPYVAQKIGAERVLKLSEASPELPDLLGEIGGDSFVTAAESADELLTISKTSVAEFESAEEEVRMANAAREKFHQAFVKLLAAVNL